MSESARDQLRKILGGDRSKPVSSPPVQEISPKPALSLALPASQQDVRMPSITQRIKVPPTRQAPEPLLEFDTLPIQPPTTFQDAQLFLQQLRGKMARLAEEFAQGRVNSKQFQEIYAHYQQQRNLIEVALYDMPGSDSWRNAVVTGQTAMLRQRNAAQVLSYAIYDNATSLPLASVGNFAVDTALLVPMLSSFRSATAEMFGGGLRSTEIEGGRWLCFVPGRHSTLFVIFSLEPARLHVTLIEDLHRDFEVANRHLLEQGEGADAARQFTRLWALDRVTL